MNYYIVIPCHNEAAFIEQTLASLVSQTHLPKKIVVVNDQSTDGSEEIMAAFAKAYSFISYINIKSSAAHLPGSKVISAFNKGLATLDDAYDILCKYDADLIFPKNYLATLTEHFKSDSKIGMVGGFCFIEEDSHWVLEHLTNKDHIRGALKAYRKQCFQDIEGLKLAMGWDTIDELLARFHGWKIKTDERLHVKHLKPTGATYNKAAKLKQGAAFYSMRYGFWLTLIASLKLARRKGKWSFLKDYMSGYFRAKRSKNNFLVSQEEGQFIRKHRWKGIRSKLNL